MTVGNNNVQKFSGNATSGFFDALRRRLVIVIAAVVTLGGAGNVTAGPANASASVNPLDCENPSVIRFSVIPEQGAGRQADAYLPLIEALEKKIGRRIEIVRATSYGSVVDGLVNARLDLGVLGPASYVAARRRDPGIVSFASHEKQGGAFHEAGKHYRAVLIVGAASGIATIDQLRGRRLALTDPASTSGALLPRQQFRREEAARLGASFEQFFGSVIYAGDHRRAALAVLEKHVDAAYVADDVLSALVREGKLEANAVRLLWRSAPIHRDPYVYRSALCEPLKRSIREAFLTMRDDRADGVLAGLGIVRFVPVGDAEYRSVEALFEAPAR